MRGPKPRPAEDRFWEKVDKRGPNGCWEWTANIYPNGYGCFMVARGQSALAHRFAYTDVKGPPPPGLVLDHLCRNKLCVNPDHLEPVTQRENVARGDLGRKTHCIHGHEFTPENTRIKANGCRACRACHAARERRRRAAV